MEGGRRGEDEVETDGRGNKAIHAQTRNETTVDVTEVAFNQ